MHKILNALILISSFTFCFSQVVINGKIECCKQDTVYLKSFTDLISYNTVNVNKALINEEGNFVLKTSIRTTQFLKIKVGWIEKTFLAEPNTEYDISITPTGRLTDQQKNVPGINDYYTISIKNDSLNNIIDSLEQDILDFFLNYPGIITGHEGGKLLSFCETTETKYSFFNNSFFKNYINYSLASLKWMVFKNQRPDIGVNFLKNDTVLFANPGYMSFVKDYFSNYFVKGSLQQIDHFKKTINQSIDFFSIWEELSNDKLLNTDTLRELAMLIGLKDVFGKDYYNSEHILKLINYMSVCAMNTENQIIAYNISRNLSAQTSKARHFSLPYLQHPDSLYTTNDWKGKYVCLSFVYSSIPESSQEIELLKDIYSKYNDRVLFVTIICDARPEWVNKGFVQRKVEWPLLYFNKNYNLLEQYQVNSFPHFAIINDKMNVSNHSRLKPSDGLEQFLFEQLDK